MPTHNTVSRMYFYLHTKSPIIVTIVIMAAGCCSPRPPDRQSAPAHICPGRRRRRRPAPRRIRAFGSHCATLAGLACAPACNSPKRDFPVTAADAEYNSWWNTSYVRVAEKAFLLDSPFIASVHCVRPLQSRLRPNVRTRRTNPEHRRLRDYFFFSRFRWLRFLRPASRGRWSMIVARCAMSAGVFVWLRSRPISANVYAACGRNASTTLATSETLSPAYDVTEPRRITPSLPLQSSYPFFRFYRDRMSTCSSYRETGTRETRALERFENICVRGWRYREMSTEGDEKNLFFLACSYFASEWVAALGGSPVWCLCCVFVSNELSSVSRIANEFWTLKFHIIWLERYLNIYDTLLSWFQNFNYLARIIFVRVINPEKITKKTK